MTAGYGVGAGDAMAAAITVGPAVAGRSSSPLAWETRQVQPWTPGTAASQRDACERFFERGRTTESRAGSIRLATRSLTRKPRHEPITQTSSVLMACRASRALWAVDEADIPGCVCCTRSNPTIPGTPRRGGSQLAAAENARCVHSGRGGGPAGQVEVEITQERPVAVDPRFGGCRPGVRYARRAPPRPSGWIHRSGPWRYRRSAQIVRPYRVPIGRECRMDRRRGGRVVRYRCSAGAVMAGCDRRFGWSPA